MPTYNYVCKKCNNDVDIMHMMSDDSKRKCSECGCVMEKQIGCGYLALKGFKPSLADHRESEHTKKVKDKERAHRRRRKAFGQDSVGNSVDVPDPKHLIRGRTLGGQFQDVDKKEIVKALAKDNFGVEIAKRALNKP